ncbi:MAG: glycosyltransferase family 2 protein [Candidatus Sungbacteria bacterium]|uniref:Glycosyltransferase family 2 protein n=1 Tax=Candidatus Sungiibacteriota bacterium TaxID=2750080 RepID=A0A932YWF2_9BACT|nr:glycosyltransferase family 2 protein [Candidatus Sungbacteria bacterium]
MWNGKTISLVLPTYREKDSIRRVLEEFIATSLLDEVIVVDNNAEAGTREEIQKVKGNSLITVIHEKRQGYGYALQTGLLAAKGDWVVSIEPDGTYSARDLKRFFVFGEDFQVVLGSRTITKTKNKDWGFWRREVNILYGLLIHLLFHASVMTETGCTYKLLHRDVIRRLAPQWRETSSYFATELLLLVVANGINFVEVPVTFRERIGPSTVVTGNLRLFKLGWVGLRQIMSEWFHWLGRRTPSR